VVIVIRHRLPPRSWIRAPAASTRSTATSRSSRFLATFASGTRWKADTDGSAFRCLVGRTCRLFLRGHGQL